MIITGIICLLVGGLVGFYARAKVKMTLGEFQYQLSRLDAQETDALVKVLERDWGISMAAPKLVPLETRGKDKQ